MAEPGLEPEPGSEPVTAEAVLRELRLFELRCQGEEVPDKLVELCLSHGLGPVALANELLAFVTSRDLDPRLTPEGLAAFEHEVLAKRGRRGRDERRGLLHDARSLQELLREEQEDELLDAYATPCKGSQKRGNSTPETPRPKRAPSSRSPYGLFSPGSFSPSVTPSQKYSSRGARGEVVASLGSARGAAWSGGGGGGALRLFGCPERSLTRPYKFMFQKALDVREVLAERVEELGEVLRRHHGLDGFGSTAVPAQEPVTLLGQVSCDGNGKLNARSVLLVGDLERSGGAPLPLDLSELPEYSLFPGQVLAVEGINSTGRRMVVSKLYEGVPLPFHTPTEPMAGQRMVLVACGPFTPSDGVAFEPLSDLLEVVARDRPDVCILLGPFLDAKHEQVESCQLLGCFSDVFRLCLHTIVEGTRGAGCQLVLVPSLRDVSHDFVYPQPPFPFPDLPKEDRARVLLVPEPCVLDIDGVVFGLTSTDLLFHMGAEEISSSSGISDRFTRILRHVLTQRSFYPLYPPSEELNVDLEALAAFAALPVTPDVLVTPSELRFFVKDVLGCVCINPGRLTKGRAGGTYGRLLLRRDHPGDNSGDNTGNNTGNSPGNTGNNTGNNPGNTGNNTGNNPGDNTGNSPGKNTGSNPGDTGDNTGNSPGNNPGNTGDNPGDNTGNSPRNTGNNPRDSPRNPGTDPGAAPRSSPCVAAQVVRI